MEEWRTITYDDEVWERYEVSTKGRIRNVKTGRILKSNKNSVGYLCVSLCRNGEHKSFLVHRLVATMFIPNPHNLPEVDHIDRDKLNCCVENLRWVSKKENGENSGKRVLCVETGKIYETIQQASEELGITHGNIVKVCNGQRKTCGGYSWKYVD